MSRIIYGTDEKIPGESAYDRCSYRGCKNGKYRLGGRKLFLFPSHTEPERREKWLLHCGNEELRKKADSSIRRSGICSDHFDPSCFTDNKKYSLKRNSIPYLNYPSNLTDTMCVDNDGTVGTKPVNQNRDINFEVTINNVPTRVPKLFVDDDSLSDDDSKYCRDYEDLSSIQKNENDELCSQITFINSNKNNCEFKNSKANSKFLMLNNGNEFNSVTNCLYTSSSLSIEKQKSNFVREYYKKINPSMSTVELLRKINEEHNKDKKIQKLIKQNMLLRKELKTLKQNIRRWERQRQKKSISIKNPTLKQQKRMILNILDEMDISPVAKTIISLQLHTRKAPYTDEEKNLVKSVQQYSRTDIKRLLNVGCNVPSRSSIKRWKSNLNESISSLSSSSCEQDFMTNENTDVIINFNVH